MKPVAAAVLRDPFGESDPIAVQGLPAPLEPPTSVSELADVLADVTELTCQWLLRASVGAPAETRVAFHSYVARAAAAASAATTLRGGAYAGLATGLYALSPSAPSGPPTVLSHGMLGRARTAAAALLNRGHGVAADSGLSTTMAALSNAGVRVRWAGVGASLPASAAAASGAAAGTGAAGSSTTAGAPKFGFAGAASTAALGGFLGTPWAQLPLSKLLALGTSPGAIGGTAEGSVVGVAADDDDAGSEANDDVGSVAGRSTVLRTVRSPGELQASALEASIASGVDVLGLRPATASALAAALFKLDGAGAESQPWTPVDPLVLVASRAAPSFISVSERQTFFMGQVRYLLTQTVMLPQMKRPCLSAASRCRLLAWKIFMSTTSLDRADRACHLHTCSSPTFSAR